MTFKILALQPLPDPPPEDDDGAYLLTDEKRRGSYVGQQIDLSESEYVALKRELARLRGYKTVPAPSGNAA